jgi:S1-C subfamily serine protease
MEEKKVETVQGVATADPLTLFGRTPIRITQQVFTIEQVEAADPGEPSNHGVTSLTAFNGALLTISFRDGSEQHTLGSGVLVHPGVAITAKHVVKDWLPALASGAASVVCQAARSDLLLLWDVTSVQALPDADLAVVTLRYRADLPPGNQFFVAHATTRMPQIGERVFLCGFTSDTARVPVSSRMALSGLNRIGEGRVIEVWPSGRDRVMLPSASFAVDCPAFGGMSGGPVFDNSGRFIGVVTSSNEGEDDLAYVSHVWPALVSPIEPIWPRQYGPTTLLHMGRKCGVDIHGADAFSIQVSAGKPQLAYRPWS